jgi:hypothetical protein
MQISSDSSVSPIAPISASSLSNSRSEQAPTSQSAPATSGNGTVASQTLAAVYVTSAAGRDFSASVDQSGSVYVATLPYPPGGTASGESIQQVENNLTIRIDELA